MRKTFTREYSDESNVMRHEYKQLSEDDQAKIKAVKDKGLEFWELVNSLGNSRELSKAKTEIEDAVMWATKHLTA